MKLYLAYGANTNFENMNKRCPDAKYICNITLHHHRLVFRGVADAVPSRGSKVVCAVWLITPKCEEALDGFEGFPYMYVKRYVTVHLNGRKHRMMFYVMTKPGSRGESLPSESYERCLREGYADCGMPSGQIDRAMRRAAAWQLANPNHGKAHHGSWKPKAKAAEVAPISETDKAADDFVLSWFDVQEGGV